MSTLALTGADLVRALGQVTARPAVARAIRERAEALSAEIEAREPAAAVRIVPRGEAEVAVTVSAPGLFAREFGSIERPAEPAIGPAIEQLAGRRE